MKGECGEGGERRGVEEGVGGGGGGGTNGRVKGERNRWMGRVGAEKGLWKRSGMQYNGENICPKRRVMWGDRGR